MGPRRKAREYALQMLFQWDITHDSIDQIITTFFSTQEESEGVADFARRLVTRTVENVEKIDVLIQRHAEHWRLDRMATRSEEHTSELQSQSNLVCRLLLEKKKNKRCVVRRLFCSPC